MEWFFYVTAALAGLLAGSFLNVVIYRGPSMWGLIEESDGADRGTLLAPRSYCPQCRTRLSPLHLIPLASYLALRGRCAACGAAIPPRYPLVELAGALAALGALALFGASPEALLAAIFLWSLIALAAIDFETGFLPDALTLPLLLFGLLANVGDRFVPLEAAAVGAAAGYAAFGLIALAYAALRGREGLGAGDAKLLAAIGAWGGWPALAPAVFVGALATLAVVGVRAVMGKRVDAAAPIAFGPGLCLGGAAAFLGSAAG
ncbi:prepilin peptidase [Amphiplicatus metriothermophilus]|uniref:Prepilin leader peptidase/N-methyltransferase n=1 Tax=Amphiplicatus metriothermophilus TaxID=1519374 RepID=A0A239PPM2_9PROT|nr:A24 family peptidase [Amphiplicatus metriothermophilus]MBB5518765.1 leader peptidase (prepilin peptidase)/N-methyltransferase [Amphiplicatus metriothermophilus]SNT72080.1 type 4 prepilin peptidase 1 Aspartic peptidase. MEROPS family A24A [Amphiplicatus metriothermophilus]